MILTRYLCRELVHLMLLIVVLLLVILVSNMFIHYLSVAASGSMLGSGVAYIIGLMLPRYLALLLPISLYFAIILAYGRLFADNELTVMFANGMSPLSLLKITLLPASIIGILVLSLNLWVLPHLSKEQDTLTSSLKNKNNLMLIGAGRFVALSNDQTVIYIDSLDNKTQKAQGVFIYKAGSGSQPGKVMLAKTASQGKDPKSGTPIIQFENSSEYRGYSTKANFQVSDFPKLNLVQAAMPRLHHTESIQTSTLWHSHSLNHLAELHWRIATALACWVLAIMAVAICRVKPRKGRYSKLLYAILLFLLYFNCLSIGKVSISQGQLPPYFGLIWVQICFGGSALAMIMHQSGRLHWPQWTKELKHA